MWTRPHDACCAKSEQAVTQTCHYSRRNSRQQRSFGSLVHPGKWTEEQPVLSHGVNHSRHREHGAQQTKWNKKHITFRLMLNANTQSLLLLYISFMKKRFWVCNRGVGKLWDKLLCHQQTILLFSYVLCQSSLHILHISNLFFYQMKEHINLPFLTNLHNSKIADQLVFTNVHNVVAD